MGIDEIREQISDKFSSVETHELWDDILQDTSPANYGYEVDCVTVAKNDIYVDIPNRTFTFKNLELQFSAQLGASNPNDGYNEDFEFTLSGTGTFRFMKGNQDIEIENISTNNTIDLYGDGL